MRRVSSFVVLGVAAAVLSVSGCGDGLQAVYPPRPPATPGLPIAEPTPSRVVVHATVSAAALKKALDEQVPSTGAGTFPLLGGERKYSWQRVSTAVSFSRGRIALQAQVLAKVSLPLTELSFPIELKVHAEPVVAADYRARLQSLEVDVTSSDPRLKLAQSAAGALDKIKEQIEEKLKEFTYDLRPILAEAHSRIAKPIEIPLGDARGCAELRVIGVEAGPTVLADGVEKDLALVIAPSVTLPCAASPEAQKLPPLANVAAVPSGPFTVTVPVAARYEELQKAMSLAFTDGKLYFSKELPQLYLSNPEVYTSKDQVVVKLHLQGPVKKGSIKVNLDGDLYMIGTPTIVDNELRVPDLEPTIETRDFLLKLAAAISGAQIRDAARAALRLDIGQRLQSVRAKLSSDLAFGDGQGCLKADVSKIAVTGVHAHASYLRVYVSVTAQAGVYLPCPQIIPSEPIRTPPPAVSTR
jgi:hypothetical protein